MVVVLGLAPATAAGCIVPDGHRVVERTDEAIVTLETVGEDEDPLDGETVERTWRGCDFAATRVVELHRGQSSLGAYSSARAFRLAGPRTAFVVIEATKYDSAERIVTVDLRDGTRWESVPISLGFTQVALSRVGSRRSTPRPAR